MPPGPSSSIFTAVAVYSFKLYISKASDAAAIEKDVAQVHPTGVSRLNRRRGLRVANQLCHHGHLSDRANGGAAVPHCGTSAVSRHRRQASIVSRSPAGYADSVTR
eukprot:s523_g8.t1